MADSHLRLRSVTWKDSRGSIRVLPGHDPKPGRTIVEAAVRKALDGMVDDVCGCAFVTWAQDGGSNAIIRNAPESPLLSMQIAGFVEERLRYDITERWLIEAISDQWGPLPPRRPDGAA